MRSPQYVFDKERQRWVDRLNPDESDDRALYGDSSWAESILDLCGCGAPDQVVRAMHAYLARVKQSTESQFAISQIDHGTGDDAYELSGLLLAYMADRLGFTEHGGSVGGAWMLPAGLRWMTIAERESS